MPRYNPETEKWELTRREIFTGTAAALLLAGCGSPRQDTRLNPTLSAPPPSVAPAATAVIQGPPAAPLQETIDPQTTEEERAIGQRGFEVSLDTTQFPGAFRASESDRANVIHAIHEILEIAPEITNFYDPNQRVSVFVLNSYINGQNSGITGVTGSDFALTIQGLENRRNQNRIIVITSQAIFDKYAKAHPETATFNSTPPASQQRGATMNEMFNYLQGSKDITAYAKRLNTSGILINPINDQMVTVRSIGGSIMIYNLNSGQLIGELSGPEQFFGDLLQTYIAQKFRDSDPDQITFENDLAAFASTSRFAPIAGQFNKLRTILKSESGRNLAIAIAKAKSEGDIEGLFEAIRPNLTSEEFNDIERYLVNVNISQQ